MNRTPRIAAATLAALALASLAGSGQAVPLFPPFPRSSGVGEIGHWLASQTDLPLASVVLVGPGYVFSFQPADPEAATGGLVWKQVREEVTSPGMESRLNGRSATAMIAFDCQRGQATASDVRVYAGNSLGGEAGRSVPAADWLVANPGLYLMDLAKAACSGGFVRPFAQPPAYAAPEEAATAPAANGPAARPSRAETGSEHWVQVGAFAGAAAANQRWREIQRLLPAQSAGRGVRTEPVGQGKSLVRALVGPFRGASAQAFCTALKAKGGDCLVH